MQEFQPRTDLKRQPPTIFFAFQQTSQVWVQVQSAPRTDLVTGLVSLQNCIFETMILLPAAAQTIFERQDKCPFTAVLLGCIDGRRKSTNAAITARFFGQWRQRVVAVLLVWVAGIEMSDSNGRPGSKTSENRRARQYHGSAGQNRANHASGRAQHQAELGPKSALPYGPHDRTAFAVSARPLSSLLSHLTISADGINTQ
jgi:hypothetical protein